MTRAFYVYEHVRPDTGAVFYVGRGMQYRGARLHRRAHETKRRNHIWRGIVSRNGGMFEVRIVAMCDTRDEVLSRERECIALHGKIIDGTGTLANLTDGGDGSFGLSHTEEARKKMRAAFYSNPTRAAWINSQTFKAARREAMAGHPGSMTGKRHSPETRARLSAMRSGARNRLAKRVKDVSTGAVFGCVMDAAEAIGMGKWALYKRLSGERPNDTTLRYI